MEVRRIDGIKDQRGILRSCGAGANDDKPGYTGGADDCGDWNGDGAAGGVYYFEV